MRRSCVTVTAGATAALIAGVSPAALGQVLEEIVVTAQKREENIQDVPIAISAFSAEDLKAANITNLDDIAPLTPGLLFGRFNESRPQIYIRGVGSRQFDVGSEGSVGVFVDEVYVGRFTGVLGGLGDVQRVEVLKGPQGTLYGRNTIGGAINIITAPPTEELSAYLEVGGGNLDYLSAEGALSGPIVPHRLLGRLSFFTRSRDGYVENLETGVDHNAEDFMDVRGKLLWRATDALDIALTLDINRSDPEGGLQGEWVAGLPILATGGPLAKIPDTTPSRFNEFYNSDSNFERDIYTVILRADWRPAPFDVTSISSFMNIDMQEARDLDSTPVDSITHITFEETDQFSQELRLTSKPGGLFTFGDRLDWIIGFYFLSEQPERLDNLLAGPDSVFSSIAASIDAGGPPAPLVQGSEFIDNNLRVDVDTTSVAFFGRASYALTEDLTLTFGARYTYDRKEATWAADSSRPGVPPIIADFSVDLEDSWNSFDPKVSLEYAWTDDVMTYFVYSEGFKSGGFQFAKFTPADASVVFAPERVQTYEIGMKSQWWNRRVTANLSAFRYDYSDLQVPRTTATPGGAPTITTVNAAQATVEGAEIEGIISLTEGLSLNLGYAFLDAVYDEYVFDSTTDFSGNRMVRSPEHTFNVGFNYRRPLAEGRLVLRGDLSWTDEYFFEADEGATPGTEQGDFALVNASVAYERGPWRLTIWGRNLTDQVYRTTTLSFGAFTMEYLGVPRTYGATLSWRYD